MPRRRNSGETASSRSSASSPIVRCRRKARGWPSRIAQRPVDAGHRQDSGALRPGPGLAEAVVEGGVHDLHDGIEVDGSAVASSEARARCGGRVHAASSPGRPARAHRPASAAAIEAFGKPKRIARRRPARAASALAARVDQRLGAGPDDQIGDRCVAAASAGGRLNRSLSVRATGRRIAGRTARRGRRPWLPRHVPSRGAAPAARSASDDIPFKLAIPGDRQSLRGGDPDADSGEAARSDADKDRSARRPSSISSSIGTSRSHGHGRSSHRDARDRRRRCRTARRCTRQSRCRWPGSRPILNSLRASVFTGSDRRQVDKSEDQTASTDSTSGT